MRVKFVLLLFLVLIAYFQPLAADTLEQQLSLNYGWQELH